jgi:amidophosphoribosyltransferase
MCGIAGICLADVSTAALPELLEASLLLQHRGQDACGIATYNRDGQPTVQKDFGLVTEVFGEAEAGLQRLSGSMGIVHGELIPRPN